MNVVDFEMLLLVDFEMLLLGFVKSAHSEEPELSLAKFIACSLWGCLLSNRCKVREEPKVDSCYSILS